MFILRLLMCAERQSRSGSFLFSHFSCLFMYCIQTHPRVLRRARVAVQNRLSPLDSQHSCHPFLAQRSRDNRYGVPLDTVLYCTVHTQEPKIVSVESQKQASCNVSSSITLSECR